MRRVNDFYPTPEWATNFLVERVSIGGWIFECCSGNDDIANVLARRAGAVITNDIDTSMPAMFHRDILEPWDFGEVEFDWVVTNPPFNLAPQIVPRAYNHAREGIAMLLRLSFLEPVENRGPWLNQHPPTRMLVLPRISFTGDGKTDSVTCAWMVWEKGKQGTITVAENPKFATASKAA